jgi:tryptophan-rich sensory protein
MLQGRKRGPTHVRYQSEAVVIHGVAGWAATLHHPELTWSAVGPVLVFFSIHLNLQCFEDSC